jgi:hypothetical protein
MGTLSTVVLGKKEAPLKVYDGKLCIFVKGKALNLYLWDNQTKYKIEAVRTRGGSNRVWWTNPNSVQLAEASYHERNTESAKHIQYVLPLEVQFDRYIHYLRTQQEKRGEQVDGCEEC